MKLGQRVNLLHILFETYPAVRTATFLSRVILANEPARAT
jgi:hypothetical protein